MLSGCFRRWAQEITKDATICMAALQHRPSSRTAVPVLTTYAGGKGRNAGQAQAYLDDSDYAVDGSTHRRYVPEDETLAGWPRNTAAFSCAESHRRRQPVDELQSMLMETITLVCKSLFTNKRYTIMLRHFLDDFLSFVPCNAAASQWQRGEPQFLR